jgi:UDP-N-acetylglucosamine:LPS N-acetylglucosamine transferase
MQTRKKKNNHQKLKANNRLINNGCAVHSENNLIQSKIQTVISPLNSNVKRLEVKENYATSNKKSALRGEDMTISIQRQLKTSSRA